VNKIADAPHDGTRILIRYKVYHFEGHHWVPTGSKWEECRFFPFHSSGEARWQPWCGKGTVCSTQIIAEADIIDWQFLPETKE
jgi:hypothetical protein